MHFGFRSLSSRSFLTADGTGGTDEAIFQSLINPRPARHPAKLAFDVQETTLQLKEHWIVTADFFQNLPVFTTQQVVIICRDGKFFAMATPLSSNAQGRRFV